MTWLRVLRDVLFPASCEGCAGTVTLGARRCLCDPCWTALAPPEPPLCGRCGVPLRRAAGPAPCCSTCVVHPPTFATARGATLYRPRAAGLNPLPRTIGRLKYARRRRIAMTLGDLLALRWPFPDEAVLVPVPLHVSRLRERGFNQALLLARALARHRGLAVAPRALARVRATRSQSRLTAVARRRNLMNAFVARDARRIVGRHVVVIDDVMTTGATAEACAHALHIGGAIRVDVWTVGRAPHDEVEPPVEAGTPER